MADIGPVTLDILASQIIRTLSGGDQARESKFDRRDIILRCRQVLNELLNIELQTRRENNDRSVVPIYVATYNGNEVQDYEEDQFYIQLPNFFLGMAHNKGLVALYPDNKPELQYIRRNNPYVTNGLRSAQLNGKSYFIEQEKLILDTKDPDIKNTKFTMKLHVAAPSTLGPNEILPILNEHQAELIRRVTSDMLPLLGITDDRLNNNDPLEVAAE